MQVTPEEEEKKRVRRERNKQAAAKCRNRRRELTDTLQAVSIPQIYHHSSEHFSPQLIVLPNSWVNAPSSISLSLRKLISLRMRSPACRMILLIFWRRRRGSSSFSLPTSPSAKSPPSWTQTSLSSQCLQPASQPGCPPSHRPPSPRHPLSLPASQPSPPLPPPLPTPSSPPPPFPTARSRWQTWTPPSWRSLWICSQRLRWRRRGQCRRLTCPTPSTQLRTGRPFTPQPPPLTSSPCARLWWPAHRPAPPSRLLSCLPSQRRRPSPPAASPTGEEATATTSPLIRSAHPPCWPFKDSSQKKTLPISTFSWHMRCADHRAMERTCTRKQIIYDFICLYLYLPITPM